MLCEVVLDSGGMARVPDLRAFADEHGLLLVSIADLIEYRKIHDRHGHDLPASALVGAHPHD